MSTISGEVQFSTGSDLAPIFIEKRWSCLHVQSQQNIPADFLQSFKPCHFVENLVADYQNSSIENIVDKISQYSPRAVICGTETGVELADILSSRLGLVGNEPKTSDRRRNKFIMQQAIAKAGLSSIRQFKASNVEEGIDWCKTFGEWPVVVKPLDSAGSDGVQFCFSLDEVRSALEKLLGKINRLGLFNNAVVLQERLKGQQYIVNAVSIGGQHKFTEIWRDDKKPVEGASLICDREELLPFEGPEQEKLLSYMRRVLDALGVMDGPSHSEIMMTDRGPVLIETAARLQGTILHEAVIEALGYSHVTMTVDRYADPESFAKTIKEPYKLRKAILCVTLASSVAGTVVENNCEQYMRSLKSFSAMLHTIPEGERIERTVDLFTNPGIVYLIHNSKDQLLEDYAQIRDWEAAGVLYNVKED